MNFNNGKVMSYRQKLERTRWIKQIELPDEINEMILAYVFCCDLCLPARMTFCDRFRYCKISKSNVYDGINSKSPLNRTKNTREAINKRIADLEACLEND